MNIKRLILHILLLCTVSCLTVGCGYNYIEKPEKLLSEKQMVDIICEFAYINSMDDQGKFQNDPQLSAIGKAAFVERVYIKYDVNKQILEQNNTYYTQNSKKYLQIYQLALDRLNKQIDQEEKRLQNKDTNPNIDLQENSPHSVPLGVDPTLLGGYGEPRTEPTPIAPLGPFIPSETAAKKVFGAQEKPNQKESTSI